MGDTTPQGMMKAAIIKEVRTNDIDTIFMFVKC